MKRLTKLPLPLWLALGALVVVPSAGCDDGTDTGDDDDDGDDDDGDDDDNDDDASEDGSEAEVPEEYAGKTNPYSTSDSDKVDAGMNTYEANCQICHGEDGMGNNGAAKDFTSSEAAGWADDFMLWKVSEGDGDMPPFKSSLSEDEIWEVITYCRTFSE